MTSVTDESDQKKSGFDESQLAVKQFTLSKQDLIEINKCFNKRRNSITNTKIVYNNFFIPDKNEYMQWISNSFGVSIAINSPTIFYRQASNAQFQSKDLALESSTAAITMNDNVSKISKDNITIESIICNTLNVSKNNTFWKNQFKSYEHGMLICMCIESNINVLFFNQFISTPINCILLYASYNNENEVNYDKTQGSILKAELLINRMDIWKNHLFVDGCIVSFADKKMLVAGSIFVFGFGILGKVSIASQSLSKYGLIGVFQTKNISLSKFLNYVEQNKDDFNVSASTINLLKKIFSSDVMAKSILFNITKSIDLQKLIKKDDANSDKNDEHNSSGSDVISKILDDLEFNLICKIAPEEDSIFTKLYDALKQINLDKISNEVTLYCKKSSETDDKIRIGLTFLEGYYPINQWIFERQLGEFFYFGKIGWKGDLHLDVDAAGAGGAEGKLSIQGTIDGILKMTCFMDTARKLLKEQNKDAKLPGDDISWFGSIKFAANIQKEEVLLSLALDGTVKLADPGLDPFLMLKLLNPKMFQTEQFELYIKAMTLGIGVAYAKLTGPQVNIRASTQFAWVEPDNIVTAALQFDVSKGYPIPNCIYFNFEGSISVYKVLKYLCNDAAVQQIISYQNVQHILEKVLIKSVTVGAALQETEMPVGLIVNAVTCDKNHKLEKLSLQGLRVRHVTGYDNGYTCNDCKKLFNSDDEDGKSNHCETCAFDLCDECVKKRQESGKVEHGFNRNNGTELEYDIEQQNVTIEAGLLVKGKMTAFDGVLPITGEGEFKLTKTQVKVLIDVKTEFDDEKEEQYRQLTRKFKQFLKSKVQESFRRKQIFAETQINATKSQLKSVIIGVWKAAIKIPIGLNLAPGVIDRAFDKAFDDMLNELGIEGLINEAINYGFQALAVTLKFWEFMKEHFGHLIAQWIDKYLSLVIFEKFKLNVDIEVDNIEGSNVSFECLIKFIEGFLDNSQFSCNIDTTDLADMKLAATLDVESVGNWFNKLETELRKQAQDYVDNFRKKQVYVSVSIILAILGVPPIAIEHFLKTGVLDKAMKGVEDAGKAVEHAVNETGKAVGHVVNETGKAVENTVDTVKGWFGW